MRKKLEAASWRIWSATGLLIVFVFTAWGEGNDQFGKEIWPIIQSRCLECHGPAKQKGKLRLDSAEAIAKGGDSGALFTAGKPEESLIIKRLTAPEGDSDMMPAKGGRLPQEQIDLIKKWIQEGASFGGWTAANADSSASPETPAAAPLASVKLPAPADLPTRKLTFNRDIRPILSDKCYRCHGPDKNARKANLRLDKFEEAARDLGGRCAIVPGDITKSELVKRIYCTDPKEIMPAPASEKTLNDSEKGILAAWVAQGAEYEPHWAFIPPKRTTPPMVEIERNPIDAFISAKLNELHVKPAPQADPATLVRRLSFDLTGLPPNPETVAAFAKNPTEEAYGKLVDEFLGSPRFGERMAVNWLDQVRYADSTGYHSDEYRSVWPYRDYVINSFNANKRFDQFTIEQLAGDLLPHPTREQLIGSGFNRLNQTTAEGGAQAKEYRAKYNADRVRAVASVWLGATMGCCECHDHKFDPFTSKDFYSLAAFFADLDEDDVFPGEDDWAPLLRLPNERQAAHLKALDEFIKSLDETQNTQTPELTEAQHNWEAYWRTQNKSTLGGWIPVRPSNFTSEGGATLSLLDDFSILSSGVIPFQETYTVTIPTGLEKITGLRFQALWHPSFKKGVTRTRGQFYLNEFEAELSKDGGPPQTVAFASAKSDDKSITLGADVSKAIDGDMLTAWFKYPSEKEMRKTVTGIFTFREPIAGGPGTVLTVRLRHQGGAMFDRTAFARIRFALTTDPEPSPDAKLSPPEIVFDAPSLPDRPKEIEDALAGYYRTVAPELQSVRDQLEDARERRFALLKEIPTTLVSKQREQPRVVRILKRGNWQDESGEIVAPNIPTFLPPLRIGDRYATRMDLAEWIVSRENPLTSRVIVNRFWKLFFGRGITKSLDDLGAQGEWPNYPELLDWLACEFVDSGWDMKHIIREMVTSRAYRRSSSADIAAREFDPDNRWFARQAAFRLEAEAVRDNALAVSGLLNPAIGGPSFKPYQPDGYWEHLNFPKRAYVADSGPGQYRRGLYVHWQRSFLHTSMKAFDAPTREECTAQRIVSNSPLQALVLLNDPTYVEAARVFAARIMREGGSGAEDRIRWAFRQVLDRDPSAEEARVVGEVCAKHLEEYKADATLADQAISTGFAANPADLDHAELAAWTSVARILLNLHETVTRS